MNIDPFTLIDLKSCVDQAQQRQWERERCNALHEICLWIAAEITNGVGKLEACAAAAEANKGRCVYDDKKNPKPLAVSAKSLRRAFDRWKHAKTPFSLKYGYVAGRAKCPSDLVIEFKRRCVERGETKDTEVYKSLVADWDAGKVIPGLGDWEQWYRDAYPDEPVLDTVPEFPFSYATLHRRTPSRAVRALGNKGIAAMRRLLPPIPRDYSKLRPAEVLIFDDKEADVWVIDEVTGNYWRPKIYVAMDACARFIPAIVSRIGGEMMQRDVDQLVAYVLMTYGIGRDYPTHLVFEHGTVAMSREKQKALEDHLPGRVYVHRPTMDKGRTHAGAYPDKGSGNPQSKAPLEAFMKKLDALLRPLPGQATRDQQRFAPADLGATKDAAQRLAWLEKKLGIKLELPLLRYSEFADALRAAIDAHHNEHNHHFEGFSTVLQVQTAPDVWEDVP